MRNKTCRLVMSAIMMGAAVAACSSSGSGKGDVAESTSQAAAFNADSAYSYIADQVSFGPRVPETAAHVACHDYLVGKLESFGFDVEQLDTVFLSPNGETVPIRNIYAEINQDSPRKVMLVAHYDTRPWADRDDDPGAYNTPIDGANDGGSGVGVILEIARNAKNAATPIGLQVLLVDYEDSGTYSGDDREWCLGSQAYAASLTPLSERPRYAIVLDMVGGRGATFPREYFSNAYARGVVDRVWGAAARIGQSSRFPDRVGGAINDDHIPLIEAGIPTIDIVESANPATGSFNPTWHTLDDTLENIDKATLQAVGDVVTEAIYR